MEKAASGVLLTEAQRKAIERERERWVKVGMPQPYFDGSGCVLIECFYKSGYSMWIGIEKDGYAHS